MMVGLGISRQIQMNGHQRLELPPPPTHSAWMQQISKVEEATCKTELVPG